MYHYVAEDGTIAGTGKVVRWTSPDVEGAYGIDIWVSDGEEDPGTKRIMVSVIGPPDKGDEGQPIHGLEGSVLIMALLVSPFFLVRKRTVSR